MKIRLSTLMGATAAILLSALAAQAQTTLKWAHVYETSEPFHTDSVWAAEEIAKRTDGRYKIDVFPASQLGKEADINQGLKIGTVRGYANPPSFLAANLDSEEEGDDFANLRKLEAGRIDLVLIDRSVAEYLIADRMPAMAISTK